MDNSQVYSDDVVNIANSLLNDLKNSYQTWEDLVSKCGKFHSALKAATQASSAFLDAFQKVADLATKTYGGSKEIGACLTRYCMRQKSLESKVKSMSNHLVTSLANPLSSKVDEWRRNLYQLEKDRTRQTKRVRAELKKAVAEAQKWEKKAAKIGIIGSGGVGPGVGHGIIPSSNLACSNSESNAINIQAAKAAREVGIKKELVENTEKSAIRLLLLEERSRFCFFVSCLLPILECQSSMLNEIATMDELIRALTKETEYPNQLVEDVESIVLRMGRRDISVSSRGSNKTMSLFVSDSGDKTSTSNEVLGGLYMTNGNRSCVTSSDTESGRHGADMMLPFQLRRDTNSVGRCNSVCDSGDISLCGTSSHSGSGGSNCPSLLSPVRHNIARLGSRESSLMSVDSAASGSGNANPSYSIGISNTNMMHSDSEENQFKTLCRPGHCRAASNGDTDFPKHLKNGFRYDRPDCMIAKSMIAFNPQAEISESITTNGKSCPVNNDAEHKNANEDVMETHSCLDHDESNGGSDDDAEEEEEDDGGGEDGGEYVEVGGKTTHLPDESTSVLSGNLSQQYSLDNYTPNTSGPGGGGGSGDPSVPSNGRHTISSAYERGCHAPTRASITALSFNPPVGKASSKDSGVDSSAVLYPKQAVPPPVYTNLTQLTHAAQRKFSMSQLPIVHSYENVDNTLERLQYVKSDLKTNCHHFPHQLAHPNSIPTSTSQNQAMNSAQQINNATTTATATSNNTNGNWSVTSSLSKLNLNDSELNQSRGEEKYANPSGLLQSKVDKLSSNTSLSSSCFSSKHQLDGVSISGSTSVASGAVGNMPSCHQTNGADPFSMEMEELDQMLPESSSVDYSSTINKIVSKYVHDHLVQSSTTMPNYCLLPRALTSASQRNRANHCYSMNKIGLSNRVSCKPGGNTFDSCCTLNEIEDDHHIRSDYSYNNNNDDLINNDSNNNNNVSYVNSTCAQRSDFFTPQSFFSRRLLSNDGLTNSSRYSLCNSLYPASSESSVKEMSVNLIDHHHQSMNSPCFTNSQPPQPVPPSSSLSPPPPPPIQPKPLHLKHMQALSQYNLNKKSACLIRPCPPPRKCSVLTSQDCLMTSGVSMPCGLNTPDLSVYEGINNKYCQGNNFYEGSSRGSSLTMASSTTNDSLPSSNGSPALVSYHANARRSIPSNPPCSQSSLVNEQLLENKLHYATPVIPSSSQCCSPASQVSSLLRQSTMVSNQVCINNQANSSIGCEAAKNLPIANSSSLPPAPPPPPPLPVFSIPSSTTLSSSSYSPIEVNPANSPCYNVKSSTADSVSVETANLMSELSSQLAQLAARSNDIHYSPAKTNRISTVNNNESDKEYVKYDEFDLPPPPPSSMFNDELCCYTGQIKQNYPLNQQLTDVTVAMTATPSTTTGTVTPVVASGTPTTATSATKDDQEEESSENLSPFLLALKQSVKQRANRLANQNSIVN